MVQAYVPTNDTMDEEKDEFYNQLQNTVSSCNKNDMIVVMGDLNAKVGNNNTNREDVMGKFGVGVMNGNGERLRDFCNANGFIITGTIFPYKDIHKLTWRSPDGRTVNQIDRVLVNGNIRASISDTGKAAGVGKVCPELSTADIEDTASKLTSCYNRLRETERWPKVWKKGLVAKVFKKGDLHQCNNWIGVTLLPVISKIICRMLLERIRKGVEKKLRKEQAGFRPKRSKNEQIFILRNILEQANEWREGPYAYFVDFVGL